MAHSSAQLTARRPDFSTALLGWYHAHARRLPWRESPSLYKTVVSEFMLQQTQVATVLPYFERWLRELPDFPALAAAPESRVLKLWEGLGYYSRARNLHRLAQALVARPAPPRTPAAWRELPGIGPYTAAAVTSIAFGEPAACVDGNVVRVLARLTGETRVFRDGSEAARHFAPLAGDLLSPTRPGDHNQAMMELGATVCTRQNPRCPDCPVAAVCAGRRDGSPETLPRLRPKAVERLAVDRIWLVHRGRLLLRHGPATARRLAGMLELPEAADLRIEPTPLSLLAVRRRAITRYQITESIHAARHSAALARRIAAHHHLEWIPLSRLDSVTLSGPHRRWIRELLAARPAPSTP